MTVLSMRVPRRVLLAALALALPAGLLLSSPDAAVGQGTRAVRPGAGAPAALGVVLPKASCGDLAKLDVTALGGAGSRIEKAEETMSEQGQPICAVDGTLAPSITFRVELPTRSWTQRYLQTGCGGLCGSLNLRIGAADGCPTVQAGGFVVASTDMGHQGMSAEFGRDPQKRADFAYRGVHATALTAKALIKAFYGQAERYSYFSGCSDGGREALVEAQRFPEDFNGIIAGAPAMAFTVQNSLFHAWQARSNTGADGKPVLLASRLPILHAAVLKACDGLDGQVDGLIATPGQCRFDTKSVVCKPGQDPTSCLSAAEAEVAQRFYDGPRDAKTGERLTQGGPQYGSELQWAGVYVPQSAEQPIFSTMIAEGSMANLIFLDGQPAKLADVVFDRATFDRLRERHTLFDSTSPDLSAFAGRGGKLILFHGWADPHISPINTIAYHDAVRRQMGATAAEGFERLYLMPGMGHCSGGEGPNQFDLLTPIMAWVEGGQAPDAIETRSADPSKRSQFGLPGGGRGPNGPPPGMGRPGAGGPPPGMLPPPGAPGAGRPSGPPPAFAAAPAGPARSRPVYPYPHVAAYSGTGDVNAAASYTRGKAIAVEVPAWAGSDYFRPYKGVNN
ncbi:tannase/feruloyl esterase family alpha/beta hydrolase [Sphingomonas sp. HITSZ_GF]|uniref:tannase/feruloyl esterase family alpha/beta hydrolase n=1 Tax=Sphingomonas sp. HITSZ_GF TaxID=3037247 RepID=UPI00240E4D5F|nr:tannase/feruloyl esterase family alpha/beta hydrolase [Sphingomonas sp. HITSZ_GF]MDG2533006.1 tannase/feruloyl esterase family alpha/beta hydrolase [Sphingomonas sp. HITSZ_GF]